MSTTARKIRRTYNNKSVATAIITRAVDDFSIAFQQDETLTTLREQLKSHRFPYPILNHDEMMVLQRDPWSELTLDIAILVLFDECNSRFIQRLNDYGMRLSVKTTNNVMGVFVVFGV